MLILLLLLAIAAAFSPSGGYAPGKVVCPRNGSLIREGNSISDQERRWVQQRHKKTDLALLNFLKRVNLRGFDADKFMSNKTQSPNVALAFSGGSYRAMLSGAGLLAALDNRTLHEGLGGVLQLSTYLAGLLGGSWLIGLLAMQNFPSIDEVLFENPYDVWNFTDKRSLFDIPSKLSLAFDVARLNVSGVYRNVRHFSGEDGIGADIANKLRAGFPTSFTDVWSRGLAHQLFIKGDNNHDAGITWSDIRNLPAFSGHDMPFPVVSALARRPQSLVYDLNSPLVEFNPFEMGSFDASVNTFHDIKYLGTAVNNGRPNGLCVAGYDNAAFVLGTSLSLFNSFLNNMVCKTCLGFNGIEKFFLRRFLNFLSREKQDVAWVKPNPFFGSKYATSDNVSTSDTLYLMDGGLAGEVLPLSNMMTKERRLDAVFAFDNNPSLWPDGSLLISAYERQFLPEGKSTVCPYVPGKLTFAALNLTAKPTFFGCDALNQTELAKGGVVPPLVIYMANRPFETFSNASTYKLTWTDREKKALVQNGFDVASRANQTFASNWDKCVACALIRREQERQGIEPTPQCELCFKEYCWDGTTVRNFSTPVNYTVDGLTNGPMGLWRNRNGTLDEVSLLELAAQLIAEKARSRLETVLWWVYRHL